MSEAATTNAAGGEGLSLRERFRIYGRQTVILE
jgi:hypothetical protein